MEQIGFAESAFRTARLCSLLSCAAIFVGCDRGSQTDESPPAVRAASQPAASAAAGGEHGHQHAHAAPHGGTLVCVGDHLAHLEWVLDPEKGSLTLYVLDSSAVNGVRVGSASMKVQIRPGTADAAGSGFEVSLSPVASPLTGETAESTSQFVATSPLLRGMREFSGTLASITIKGLQFNDVAFEVGGALADHAGEGHE